jgi:hypothetical protein
MPQASIEFFCNWIAYRLRLPCANFRKINFPIAIVCRKNAAPSHGLFSLFAPWLIAPRDLEM